MELCSHRTSGSHASASPGHLSNGAVVLWCGTHLWPYLRGDMMVVEVVVDKMVRMDVLWPH